MGVNGKRVLPGGSVLLKSALDQWESVEQMQALARNFLTPEESKSVEERTAAVAGEALELLHLKPEDVSNEESLDERLQLVLTRLSAAI